jgi:hypothetical protein
MSKLTELNDSPGWLQNLTKETQYEMYLRIKESLPILRNIFKADEVVAIESAIADYEQRNNIV